MTANVTIRFEPEISSKTYRIQEIAVTVGNKIHANDTICTVVDGKENITAITSPTTAVVQVLAVRPNQELRPQQVVAVLVAVSAGARSVKPKDNVPQVEPPQARPQVAVTQQPTRSVAQTKTESDDELPDLSIEEIEQLEDGGLMEPGEANNKENSRAQTVLQTSQTLSDQTVRQLVDAVRADTLAQSGQSGQSHSQGTSIRANPLVRKLVRENNLDLDEILTTIQGDKTYLSTADVYKQFPEIPPMVQTVPAIGAETAEQIAQSEVTASEAETTADAGQELPELPELQEQLPAFEGEAEVVEVVASVGQALSVGDTVVTLELDKAIVEVPTSVAGTVIRMPLSIGSMVTGGELMCVLESGESSTTPVPAQAQPKPASKPAPESKPKPVVEADEPAGVPLSSIQRKVAERMAKSWATVPHVTQQGMVRMTAVQDRIASFSTKVSPLAFIIRELGLLIQDERFFKFSCTLASETMSLLPAESIDVAIAVDTEHGLVAPVLRNVANKDIEELTSDIKALAEKARSRQLSPQDFAGAVTTVSNLGGVTTHHFNPIITPPQLTVLGVSRTSMQPVFNSDPGAIEPAPMMPLALSYDHRVINGVDGASFVEALTQRLECL